MPKHKVWTCKQKGLSSILSWGQKHETSDTCRSGIVWPSLREMKVANFRNTGRPSDIQWSHPKPMKSEDPDFSHDVADALSGHRHQCDIFPRGGVNGDAPWPSCPVVLATNGVTFRTFAKGHIPRREQDNFCQDNKENSIEFCQVAPKTSGEKKTH